MLLQVTGIRKSYGDQPVLRGVDLELASGQSIALTGESGSGKSTLIHIIGGLDTSDAGVVRVNGVDLASLSEAERAQMRCQSIGTIFQQFNLIPSMSALANLTFQAELSGRHNSTWIEELIDRLKLFDHLSKYPEQLSGGQQQRVAIGRALAGRPALVLADEPTGNLDEGTAEATLDLLLELTSTAGAGLIMATHSPTKAARLDQTLHLQRGVFA